MEGMDFKKIEVVVVPEELTWVLARIMDLLVR
jgi:hypothetical protein